MSNRRANDMENGSSFSPDKSAKVDPTKDLTDETKAQWLKRRAKEDKAIKAGIKIVEEWYELRGDKLVKVLRKNNGGKYTLYICKAKSKPDFIKALRAEGKLK